MRAFFLGILLASICAIPASASAGDATPAFLSMDGQQHTVLAGDAREEASYSAPDVSPVRRAHANGSFVVTYKGAFPADAKVAFEYALDVWSQYLEVKVPIKVEANWKALAVSTLGTAGPAKLVTGFAWAPTQQWYPIALANQWAGTDLDPKSVDIISNFSSNQKGFYFGIDGRPPRGKFDFASVVLHEIGHGLGFTGSADVIGANGSIGSPPKYVTSAIYDAFIVNTDGKPLLGGFKTKTPELKNQFTSGTVYWNGPNGTAATPGTAPRLHAPTKWSDSSIYHLDEDIYPAGSADSLMSPVLDDEESQHRVGPITRGILMDMGWPLAPTAPALLYFLEPPGGGQPGELLAVQPRVAVLNGRGYTVADDNATVVVLGLTGADKAKLTCDGGLVKTVKAGVAAFSGCRIEGDGANLRIAASAESLPPAEGPPFVMIRRGNFRGTMPGVSSDR